ncbi:MAG: flagellar motor protein MotB, partial [Amphiplicatus sp.]
AAGADGRDGAYEFSNADRKRLEETKERLAAAVEANPLLIDSSDAITINLTEDGLQVVLIDTSGAAMFPVGGAEPTARARALLTETAKALLPLANRLVIEGHADAAGGGRYSPFELTAARANAARKVLEEAGLPASRIAGVAGRGAAIPLYPEDPYAPGNRRIEITLERAAPLLPPDRAL